MLKVGVVGLGNWGTALANHLANKGYDVVFKANADGVRLYTLSGQIKTRFTDKGMTTKEAIVEDEAQIVGTLWQEVGDQTWITRM